MKEGHHELLTASALVIYYNYICLNLLTMECVPAHPCGCPGVPYTLALNVSCQDAKHTSLDISQAVPGRKMCPGVQEVKRTKHTSF